VNLIISCFFFSSCLGISLDQDESTTLETFFRCIFEHSEGGYVLYEKKPLCIFGYNEIDNFYGESEHHRQHVILKQGAKSLKKIKHLLKNDNLIIHIYDQQDIEVYNCIHILVINKKLFLKTVYDNLPLFQYILGTEVTPEKLLEKLLDPTASFHSVLKKNEVLIGIILGFGTQNSLRGGRGENLQNQLTASEDPPFNNPILNDEDDLKLYKQHLLIQTSNTEKRLHLEPGFSYTSLKSEFNGLFNQMEVSSHKLTTERPYFIFGCLKNDKETANFIKELEKTQTKIQDLLSSKHFLNTILENFFKKDSIDLAEISQIETFSFTQQELDLLPELVAVNIWENINRENGSYIEGFFAGMQDIKIKKQCRNCLNHILKQLSIAESNIQFADKYFAELEKNENIKCLYPGKIYYNCLEEGTGTALENQTRVEAHFIIKTPDDDVLSDTWIREKPMQLDLNKTIAGFRLGMQGMKIGEIRDMFIHPTAGYGLYTTLDKGIYLKARVQLISINESNVTQVFDFIPFDFSEELALLKNSNYDQISREDGFLDGQKIWSHYKKGLQVSANQIINLILQLRSDQLTIDFERTQNQDLINQLHWNIYRNL